MLLIFLISFLLIPFSSIQANQPDSNHPSVVSEAVQVSTIYDTYIYPATIAPHKSHVLLAQHSGSISQVYVSNGQFVKKGQSVLSFSPNNPSYDVVTIKAPIDGIVTRLIAPGQLSFVQGDILFETSDTSAYLLRFHVPTSEKNIMNAQDTIKGVFIGQEILPLENISLAVVASAYGTLQATGVISFDDNQTTLNDSIVLGDLFDVVLQANKRQALLISPSSLRHERDKTVVYTIEDNAIVKKDVEVGTSLHAGKVEVLQGLEKDSEYIINNHKYLTEGQTVKTQKI